ncbi:MAG TPA: phosphoribosylaminoimidazolesuccinocarboxamide synthase, partial [Chloroflexaceae bacterium]|nr:phosphoribosylaminoimidazolesuccinocarboxamide synthase [Chloroflexaceae bacterium]
PTTPNLFPPPTRAGVPPPLVAAPDPAVTVARRCAMIPLEVVTRRLAAGSYLRRHPDMAPGTRFDPPLVELFLKDDAAHDPLIAPQEVVARGVASQAEVEQMAALALRVFAALEAAWAQLDVTLVDLKIELGRAPGGELLVADVIDNDSWRIWPGGDQARMLDKQVYRNAAEVDEALLADVRARYAQVADMTDRF